MRTERGVTLVELLVALAVSSIALSAAVLAAQSQQRAYHSGNRIRTAQNSARSALLYLEQKLPLAGYGMDASLALDFQYYKPADVDTCPAELGGCPPDQTANSDELTFYGRNPAVWSSKDPATTMKAEPKGRGWWIVGLSDGNVTIRGHKGDVFRKGQILQLVCAGLLKYAYFTLDETAPLVSTGVANEGDEVTLMLLPTEASNPFRRQDVGLTLPCMTLSGATATPNDGSAKLFQIDRYRFHIRPIPVVAGTAARLNPYLMLDSGTDTNLDGKVDRNDEEFIAEGIESLQVGYVFADRTIPAAGTTPGTGITFNKALAIPASKAADTITLTEFVSPVPLPAGETAYSYSSFFKYSTVTIPAQRQTNAQANIRRILLSIVARSPEPDPTGWANMAYGFSSELIRFNQNGAPSWILTPPVVANRNNDGYQRVVIESSVGLPNMLTRTVSYF